MMLCTSGTISGVASENIQCDYGNTVADTGVVELVEWVFLLPTLK